MHIRRVTAIIIFIATASAGIAGAEDLVSPYPTDVRVNINVAAIAEVTIRQGDNEEGPIVLTYDSEDGGFYYGKADVEASANFDYLVNINWVQDSGWEGDMYIQSKAPGFEDPHDALTTAKSEVSLSTAATAGTRDDDIPEDAVGGAEATVQSDDGDITFGVLHVTLTHQ